MTPNRHLFSSYRPFSTPVRLADGNIVYSAGVGTIVFVPRLERGSAAEIEFTRVLHVPELSCNLFSVLHLVRWKGFTVIAQDDSIAFKRNERILFTAYISESNVATLQGVTRRAESSSRAFALKTTLQLDLALWHRRTMHLSLRSLQRALRDKLVTGVTLNSPASPDPVCEPCLAGKMHADPFPSTGTKTRGVLDLVHADLVQMPVRTHSGYRYFVGFHDDCSSFHRVYLLRAKSDTFAAFKQFKAWAENITGRKIKSFQEDKGGEFIGAQWDAYLAECGIERRHSTRNRPQQNGVAERANRTIVEAIVAALAESGLPPSFWGEALVSFVHVWNRMPSSSTTMRDAEATPYELWYGRKPDLAHLRVWGCQAYVHVQRDKRSKLDWHMTKCVFIGYPDDFKGWKFWDPAQRRAFVSERADFDERYFPLSKLNAGTPSVVPTISGSPNDADHDDVSVVLDSGGDDAPVLRNAPEAPIQPPAQPPHFERVLRTPALPPDSPASDRSLYPFPRSESPDPIAIVPFDANSAHATRLAQPHLHALTTATIAPGDSRCFRRPP
jgi:transposase InsO family protein